MSVPRRIAFRQLANTALDHADTLARRWLPDGQREGHEWVCRNPRRDDRHRGSFKVSLRTGKWADFATEDRGADLISLGAFLFDLSQTQAALKIADMIGVSPYEDA
jgi:hypothetical protein